MRNVLITVLVFTSLFAFSQTQSFAFDSYKMMNHSPVWDTNDIVKPSRFVTITQGKIEFHTIVNYSLKIVSKKYFTDGNVIYKCKCFDEDVTVFLINKVQMFVYFKEYHLLIKFSR